MQDQNKKDNAISALVTENLPNAFFKVRRDDTGEEMLTYLAGKMRLHKMRILGITLPEEKRVEIGLTVLYGIGRSRAHTILDKAKVPYGLKPKEVSVPQENSIRKAIEEIKIEGDLKREVAGNIKRLKD